MQPTDTQSPGALSDRGIGWQACGFIATGTACLVILKLYEGSDFWLYQWFDTAAVDLYWAFVLPLAVLFDGGRKLFEKGKAIREAQKARMVEKARREAKEEERQRIMRELEATGVAFPAVVSEVIFEKRSGDAS